MSLPGSITVIQDYAFAECTSLKDIYYNAEIPIEGNENIFSSTTYADATLFVPESAVEKCGDCDPWENFNSSKSHYFQGIDNIESLNP